MRVTDVSTIMRQKIGENSQMIVAFKTDNYVPYGVVSDVMEQLKEVNALRVFFNNDIETNPGPKY